MFALILDLVQIYCVVVVVFIVTLMCIVNHFNLDFIKHDLKVIHMAMHNMTSEDVDLMLDNKMIKRMFLHPVLWWKDMLWIMSQANIRNMK